MPDNNFEEDVRKKMEELRFVPSGDVWNNVEENLREDRKRRRFLFWIPLAGLLVGGLVWFAWPADSKITQRKLTGLSGSQTATIDSLSDAKRTRSATTARNSVAANPKPTDSRAVTGSRSDANKTSPVQITTEAEYLASVSRAGTDKQRTDKSGRKKCSRQLKTSSQHDFFPDDDNIEVSNLSAENKMASESKTESTVTTGNPTVAFANHSLPVDSSREKNNTVKNALGSVAKNSAPAAVAAGKPSKKQEHKNNNIEWGVTAFGGISGQLEKNVIPSDVLARAYSNSTVYVIKNSVLNAGPAFSVGVVVSKQIGKTWRLQSGISYAYYSSSLPNAGQNQNYAQVSDPNAVSGIGLSAFAAPTYKNTTYTNRYQFIQVPLTIEKTLGARSPLSVQAGVSFGYLSSLHALIYQPLLDQYSQDNTKFNKFQMSGLAGVYWKFRLTGQWSLRAGPEVQYQLTNLMKSSVSVSDHLLTGGVRIILLHSGK